VLRIDPKYTYPDPNHIWKIRRPASELRWTKEKQAAVGGVQCRVITGTQHAGSQLHYSMETQACLAIPGEQDSWEIRPSTQSPDAIVSAVQTALGPSAVPANKVDVKIQRVGGGYGGKTTRPPWVAAAATVAAWCKQQNINFWDYETGWRATPPSTKTTVWENLVKLANGDRVNLSAQVRFQEEGGTGVDREGTVGASVVLN